MLFNITRLVNYLNYVFLTKINIVQYMLYAKHRTIANNTVHSNIKHYTVYTISHFSTYHLNTIKSNTIQFNTVQSPKHALSI